MMAVAGLQVQVLSTLHWHHTSYCPFGQCKSHGQVLNQGRRELLKDVDTGRYKQIGGDSVNSLVTVTCQVPRCSLWQG